MVNLELKKISGSCKFSLKQHDEHLNSKKGAFSPVVEPAGEGRGGVWNVPPAVRGRRSDCGGGRPGRPSLLRLFRLPFLRPRSASSVATGVLEFCF